MSKIIYGVALVLAAAFLASNGTAAIPGWSGQKSAPHLSLIVRHLTRPGATVYCARVAPAGNAGEARKDLNEIVLAKDVCAALKIAPRLIQPAYPRSDSGVAVFTLAHEAGHLVTPGGAMAEAQADCYATRNWRRYAAVLGFRGPAVGVLAAEIAEETVGCWH